MLCGVSLDLTTRFVHLVNDLHAFAGGMMLASDFTHKILNHFPDGLILRVLHVATRAAFRSWREYRV